MISAALGTHRVDVLAQIGNGNIADQREYEERQSPSQDLPPRSPQNRRCLERDGQRINLARWHAMPRITQRDARDRRHAVAVSTLLSGSLLAAFAVTAQRFRAC